MLSCEFRTRVSLRPSARHRISGPDAELSDTSSAIWERAPSSAANKITGSLSNYLFLPITNTIKVAYLTMLSESLSTMAQNYATLNSTSVSQGRITRYYCVIHADLCGHAVLGVGLRPLAYWDCSFEFRLGHGCLSVVCVMCWQVKISASGQSPVQKSSTECGVSEYDRESSVMGRYWLTRDCCTMGGKIK